MRVKLHISMSEELLQLVDRYADELYTSRSGIINQALVQWMQAREATAALKTLTSVLTNIEHNVVQNGGSISDTDKAQLNELTTLARMLER